MIRNRRRGSRPGLADNFATDQRHLAGDPGPTRTSVEISGLRNRVRQVVNETFAGYVGVSGLGTMSNKMSQQQVRRECSATATEAICAHARTHQKTAEGPAQCLWRTSYELLGTAAHRVLSLGVLPYRPGRCRAAHGLCRGNGGLSLFFKSKGE